MFSGNVCLVQIERDPFSSIKFPDTSAPAPKPVFSQTSAAYLKVPNYDICLEVYQEGTLVDSEYCLPREKPRLCPDLSWKHLNRVFLGIGCKPNQSIVKNVKVSSSK